MAGPVDGPFPSVSNPKMGVEIINAATKIIGTEADFLDLHTGVTKVGDLVLEKELTDLAAYYDVTPFG